MSDFSKQDHWTRVALELGLTPPEDATPKAERAEKEAETSAPSAQEEGAATAPTEAFRVETPAQESPPYPPGPPPQRLSAASPAQAAPPSGASRPGNHWRQLAEQLGVELPPAPPSALPPELGQEFQPALVSDQSLPGETPTDEFPEKPLSEEKRSLHPARPQGPPSEPPRPRPTRVGFSPEGSSSWESGRAGSERRKTKRPRQRRREKPGDRPVRRQPEFSSFPESGPPLVEPPIPAEFSSDLEEERRSGDLGDAFQAGEEKFSLTRESAGSGAPEGYPPAGAEKSPPLGLEERREIPEETEAAGFAEGLAELPPGRISETTEGVTETDASLAIAWGPPPATKPSSEKQPGTSPAAEDFPEPAVPPFLEPEEILEPEDLFEPLEVEEAQEEYEIAAEEPETPADRGPEEEKKELHRGVPTWKQVMDMILSTNRQARQRRGDRPGSGRAGRGGHH